MMKTHFTIPASGASTAEYSRPQGSELGDPYQEICQTLHTLLTRKRGYYGCREERPLDNALGVAEQGITPWVYQLARIGEKVRRCGGLRGAIVDGQVERIRETLLDIAGHAVVAIAVLDHEEQANEHQGD
jgi:hypothetical protein